MSQPTLGTEYSLASPEVADFVVRHAQAASEQELLVYVYKDVEVDLNDVVDVEVVGDRPEGEDEPPMWNLTIRDDESVEVVLQRAVHAAGFGEVVDHFRHEHITSSPAYSVTVR